MTQLMHSDKYQGTYFEFEGREGPIVLLRHGTGESTKTFDPMIPYLTDLGFSTLAVDSLGHGHSDNGDLSMNLDANRVANVVDYVARSTRKSNLVHQVGFSMGCAQALSYAQHFPERVRKMVLISPGFYNEKKSLLSRRFKAVLPLMELADKVGVRHLLKRSKEPAAVSEGNSDVYTNFLQRLWSTGTPGMYAAMDAMKKLGIPNGLGINVDHSTLIVRGTKDELFNRKVLEYLNAQLSGAEKPVEVLGGRHCLINDHPQELSALVASFFLYP